MYTERQAIQDELYSNRREIQSLRDRNGDLLKRLRELDERDFNDEISYDALSSLTESLKECIDKLAQLVPSVSALDVIKHIAEDVDPEQVILSKSDIKGKAAEEKQPRIIEEPKSETEERIQKAAIEQKHNSAPNKQKLSSERVSSVIKEILEDWGSGKVKAIEKEFIKRTGVRFANFYEKMNKAAEAYPNIQKEGFGRWIIKRPESDDKLVS